MNIIIVTAMFPPIQTGTSFYSVNIAKALLKKRGHEVKVITLRNEEDNESISTIQLTRIPALHLPVKNFIKHFRVCSIFPSNYRKINLIVKNFETDIILLVNHYLDIALPAIVASLYNEIPIICSVGTQLQSCNPIRNRVLNILDKLICGNFIFPFCKKIVAWDNEIIRYLNDIHGKRFTEKYAIINYGINGNADFFMKHKHDYSVHNQIVSVGAISEQRNYISIVRAFSLIASDFPDLRLKIIGHVYYDAAVRLSQDLKLNDKITFTGELPHSVVLDELKRSDVYYSSLSAKYVGLGTATIESMLMGIPTMANVPVNLLGKPHLKDMKHLILLNGNSPDPIAEKLRLIMNQPLLRENIGKGGRSFIAQFMNWEKVAQDMDSLMERVHYPGF